MNDGWIKLHRKFLNWEWYDSPTMVCFFIHLLMDANYKDKKWRGIEIKRGSSVMSISEYGKPMGLSRQQTRTILERLKSTNEITIKTTNKFTLIIINNYDLYQDNNQQDNQQITNNQPTNNQQITTTKEYKEINKERIEREEKKENFLSIDNSLDKINEDIYRKNQTNLIQQLESAEYINYKKKAMEFIYLLYTEKDTNGNDLWDKRVRGNWDNVTMACNRYLKIYSKKEYEDFLLAYDNYCKTNEVKDGCIMKLEKWIGEWRNFI